MTWLRDKFELARGGAANLHAMEGLRGCAVFVVFLVHYVSASANWVRPGSSTDTVAQAVHSMGNVGVDLFFVLSGYLIYGTCIARRQRLLQYLAPYLERRVVRIYPAFLAVFGIYLALSVAMPASSKIPAGALPAARYLLANLLLLPGVFPIEPLISVAWSLSYEFLFYLLAPVIVAALALRRWTPRWRIALELLVALCGLMAAPLSIGPTGLWMFLPGLMLFDWLQLRPHSTHRSSSGALAFAMVLVVAATDFPDSVGGGRAKAALLAFGLLLGCQACFSDAGGALARALSWSPLRWLGNMSYSFYLLHGLVLNAAATVLLHLMPQKNAPPAGFFWCAMPLAFGICCVVSAALFLLVERPCSLTPRASSRRPAGARACD